MSNLFNKNIKGYNFQFQSVEMGDDLLYHVNVKDDNGVEWEFRMQENDNGKWELNAEKLPGWIKAVESEIIAVIQKHN